MTVDYKNLKKETVSIIIPTLRRSEHLGRCLASLIHQTFKATEILVGIRADDHSNEEVLKKFENGLPVRSVRSQGGRSNWLDGVLSARSARTVHRAFG